MREAGFCFKDRAYVQPLQAPGQNPSAVYLHERPGSATKFVFSAGL